MSIQLGNLKLKDIIKEDSLEKIESFLEKNGYNKINKCDDVKKELGNYHIYNIPRLMIICGEEKMKQFLSFIQEEKLIQNSFIGQVALSFEDLEIK